MYNSYNPATDSRLWATNVQSLGFDVAPNGGGGYTAYSAGSKIGAVEIGCDCVKVSGVFDAIGLPLLRRNRTSSSKPENVAHLLANVAARKKSNQIFPHFGKSGEFRGYLARSISGEEIGCCLIAGETIEVSGLFSKIARGISSAASSVSKGVSSVSRGVTDVATSVRDRAVNPIARQVQDVATSVRDRAVNPVGKFVADNAATIAITALTGPIGLAVGEVKALAPVKSFLVNNAGTIGMLAASAALSVAFPPAGAVAIAAMAAQLAAQGARALGATSGFLGTLTDVVDLSGGVLTLNPQKIAESTGKVAGMVGKLANIPELQEAGASVEDIAKAVRGDPTAISKVAGAAGKLAGKVTGMKELAEAGSVIELASRAAKGDKAAITKLATSAGRLTGDRTLRQIADTVDTVASSGKLEADKLARQALKIASPQAYATLEKLDPRLLTADGIKKMGETFKSINPAEAARLAKNVQDKYTKDVTSSVNALIAQAKSSDKTVRDAALKLLNNTRQAAKDGDAGAKRAVEMLKSVDLLRDQKSNLSRRVSTFVNRTQAPVRQLSRQLPHRAF